MSLYISNVYVSAMIFLWLLQEQSLLLDLNISHPVLNAAVSDSSYDCTPLQQQNAL